MYNQQTTETVHAPQDGVTISQERRRIALEATWELEALNDSIRDLSMGLGPSTMVPDDLMPLRLKIRGLTSRIQDLVGVTMSILDEDDSTQNLARRVYGRFADAEADHA